MELAVAIIGFLSIVLIVVFFYLYKKDQKNNLKYYSEEINQIKTLLDISNQNLTKLLDKTDQSSNQVINDIEALSKLVIYQNEKYFNRLETVINNNSKQLNEEIAKVLSTIQEPWPEDLFNRR